MRRRATRANDDAKRVVRCLPSAESRYLTLGEIKSVVRTQGCPISTDVETALHVLIEQNRIEPVISTKLIRSVSDEVLILDVTK